MSKAQKVLRKCAVCNKTFPEREVASGATVRDAITELIVRDHPEWSADAYICHGDLSRYSSNYVQSLVESERGELSSLEKEVIESLRQQELLSFDVDLESEKRWTTGERLSDILANIAGSWRFVGTFTGFLCGWILFNSMTVFKPPIDPFPFILLNLLLSCLAALQAPIIMMSQGRQEARDRLRSQHDYQVNLKAELEIRHLNEKLDHLLSRQWERLVQIQEIQIQMLGELEKSKGL